MTLPDPVEQDFVVTVPLAADEDADERPAGSSQSSPGRPPVDPADLGSYAATHLPVGWGAGQAWSLQPSYLPNPIAYDVVPAGGVVWNGWDA